MRVRGKSDNVPRDSARNDHSNNLGGRPQLRHIWYDVPGVPEVTIISSPRHPKQRHLKRLETSNGLASAAERDNVRRDPQAGGLCRGQVVYAKVARESAPQALRCAVSDPEGIYDSCKQETAV